MYGDERALCLLIALPGVTPERLDVRLEQQLLVVRGERSLAADYGNGTILQLEIPYGRFERRVLLPHADYGVADMLLRNGYLRLTLEKIIGCERSPNASQFAVKAERHQVIDGAGMPEEVAKQELNRQRSDVRHRQDDLKLLIRQSTSLRD